MPAPGPGTPSAILSPILIEKAPCGAVDFAVAAENSGAGSGDRAGCVAGAEALPDPDDICWGGSACRTRFLTVTAPAMTSKATAAAMIQRPVGIRRPADLFVWLAPWDGSGRAGSLVSCSMALISLLNSGSESSPRQFMSVAVWMRLNSNGMGMSSINTGSRQSRSAAAAASVFTHLERTD